MFSKKTLAAFLIIFASISPANSLFDDVEIFHIKVKEVSDEEGLVSTLPKKFRLIVDHNPNYIPGENEGSFNPDLSPILANLNIIKRDLDREGNNARVITQDYDFNLENTSFQSPEYPGFLRSTYLSNNQVVKKAVRLTYRIDVGNYLRSKGMNPTGIKTLEVYKFDIEALNLEFSNLGLNQSSISFSKKNPNKKTDKITSEPVIILGQFSSTKDVTNLIKRSKFQTKSNNDKSITPKLKQDGTKLKQVTLKPIVNDEDIIVSFTGNGSYNTSIPIIFESKSSLNAKELSKLNNMDLLISPVELNVKTGDNLDLSLTGTLREKLEVIYSNGNQATE